MSKIIVLIIVLLSFSVHAQPLPCGNVVEMTSSCQDACIICDLDGFAARHDSDVVGEGPPAASDECTVLAHNIQWIAFVAGSVDLSLEMKVSNCEIEIGLEFGLYRGIDCDSFARISNCVGGLQGFVGPGQSATITNTEPLVIGQYYYIIMDGGLGDKCDFDFKVKSGKTFVESIVNSGAIVGDINTCAEEENFYSVSPIGSANTFDWTLNGVLLDQKDSSIFIKYSNPGSYELCVSSRNACEIGPPNCTSISVNPIPVSVTNDEFCQGDCYVIADTILCTPGFHEVLIKRQNDCDSILSIILTEVPTHVDTSVTICEGDSIIIADKTFFEAGLFEIPVETQDECKRTIFLNIFLVLCEIEATVQYEGPSCHGDSDGTIRLTLDEAVLPIDYSWQVLGGSIQGSGVLMDLDEGILIENLQAGSYIIEVEDDQGKTSIFNQEIDEPDLLTTIFELSDYNGFNISCYGEENGSISAFPIGGTSPYQYLWNTGNNGSTLEGLSSGEYNVTIIDQKGCVDKESIVLVEPSSFDLNVNFINPSCDNMVLGKIEISSLNGRIEKFKSSLNGSEFSEKFEYDNLISGMYSLSIVDENGCSYDTLGSIRERMLPEIFMPEDYVINLGDRTTIVAEVSNPSLSQILWTPSLGLSCDDCLQPSLFPLDDVSYQLQVVSDDNCKDSSDIRVSVNKLRNVYAPNIFSPNNDFVNDTFMLTGGQEVEQISNLKIYDRWGALVAWSLGDSTVHWDGNYNEQPAMESSYVWTAEVLFIDGVTTQLKGTLALVR